MNIWMINHYARPYARHHALARHLVRSGHRVVIFASSFDHKTRQERLSPGEMVRRENADGVDFVWLRTPSYKGNTPARVNNMLAFAYRVCRKRVATIEQQPDVVLGSSPHLFAALAAERVARRYGVPFVLEVRDLWPESLVELGNISRRHPIVLGLELIERYLYKRAKCIISLLPDAVDHMVLKGADRAKVVWIPNGVEVDELPEPKPPVDDGIFTVMYAGAHGLANSLDTLLDAARMLQTEPWATHVRFRLIGDGPEKERLQARVRDEGIGNVAFSDQVSRHQVYEILAGASVCCLTLKEAPLFERWGISPNKLYDYLAVARPVIFAVNSSENVVTKADAGIAVPPENPSAMVAAIKQLIAMSGEERWAMGLRGRRYVEEHHDYKRLADRFERHLRASIDGSDLPGN